MIRKVLLEFLSTRSSLDKFMHAYYGLSLPRKLWVMGYKGFMGYVGDFPASQLGRWDFLWVMGGYGLREVWVIRVSTVLIKYQTYSNDNYNDGWISVLSQCLNESAHTFSTTMCDKGIIVARVKDDIDTVLWRICREVWQERHGPRTSSVFDHVTLT